MILSACTAIAFTAASLVNTEMIGAGNNRNTSDTTPINMALYFAESITDLSARSTCFAPRFCPTNVAVALLSPHAGMMKNITTLMAV